jgi:hypothetical protein
MGGAQSQLLSAAQISLWARVRGLEIEDVDRALWKERTLAKAWCMRRTLYLLPSRDLATFVRGSSGRAEKEVRWVLNKGVSERTLDEAIGAVLSVLDRPLTGTELVEHVGRMLHAPLRQRRGGGWGSRRLVPCVEIGGISFPAYYLLSLAGARGVICSGPLRGSEATYVRADSWVARWRDLPKEEAEGDLLRRYLRAFGPATVDDFRAWTQIRLIDAKRIWAREEPGFASVEVDGWPASILSEDLPRLQRSELDSPSVRILPYFDGFLLGHGTRGHLLDPEHHRTVYSVRGWVSPVVLVDGRVAGLWSHEEKRDRLLVKVKPFGRLAPGTDTLIRAEVEDLARFLRCRTSELRLN